MMRTSVSAFAVLLLLLACGGPKSTPAPVPDTTAVGRDAGNCAQCVGSDSTGAVCEAMLPLDTTGKAPETAPKPEPTKFAAAELPRLWDFGSESCNPCKTMKAILDPMMVDYRGKVDIRVINVYQEKELAKQYRVVTIPTQVFIDAAGTELFRHIGVYPRDSIVARFKEYGWE